MSPYLSLVEMCKLSGREELSDRLAELPNLEENESKPQAGRTFLSRLFARLFSFCSSLGW